MSNLFWLTDEQMERLTPTRVFTRRQRVDPRPLRFPQAPSAPQRRALRRPFVPVRMRGAADPSWHRRCGPAASSRRGAAQYLVDSFAFSPLACGGMVD